MKRSELKLTISEDEENRITSVRIDNPDGMHVYMILGAFAAATQSVLLGVSEDANRKLADIHFNKHLADPDLIEALESLTLSMSAHPDCTEGSEFSDMVSIARKAIAKAKAA